MDILAIIYRIKEFAVTGINNFPLIVAMTSIVLVCSTANMGYSILFLCLSVFIPILVWLLNLIAPYLQLGLNLIAGLFGKTIDFPQTSADICKIASQAGGSASLYPSYWMASILFIFTFTFWNGLRLYLYESSPDAPKEKTQARQAHAVIGMVASLALMLLFVIWRFMSGCEHGFGFFMSIGFIGLAIGLFEGFRICGLLRLVDLYGIGSRLLPMSATEIPTSICFPVYDSDAPPPDKTTTTSP